MAAKKNQKSKPQSISTAQPRSYGEIYKNETSLQPPASTPAAVSHPAATAAATESISWRTEYDYVLRDLRILLLVSAVLFAIIIIAGFFI